MLLKFPLGDADPLDVGNEQSPQGEPLADANHSQRKGPSPSLQEETHWESGINEVQVARYRDLLGRGRYRRASKELADSILEQDLELHPAPVRWPKPVDG